MKVALLLLVAAPVFADVSVAGGAAEPLAWQKRCQARFESAKQSLSKAPLGAGVITSDSWADSTTLFPYVFYQVTDDDKSYVAEVGVSPSLQRGAWSRVAGVLMRNEPRRFGVLTGNSAIFDKAFQPVIDQCIADDGQGTAK